MNRMQFISMVFLFIIIILWFIKFYLETELITTGDSQYVRIENQILSYQHENLFLEEKILQSESLNNVSEQAKKKGFIDGGIFVF